MPVLTEAQYEAITGLTVGTGGVMSSARFTALALLAEARVASALGYSTLTRTTFTDRDEHAGRGTAILELSGAPMVDSSETFALKARNSADSLETIPASTYRVLYDISTVELIGATSAIVYEDSPFTIRHYTAGLRPTWPASAGDVVATYTAGYASDGSETPEAMQAILVEMVNFYAHRSQAHGNLAGVSGGGQSENYRSVTDQEQFIQDLVRPFKRAGGYLA
jgi:hypothetical protein